MKWLYGVLIILLILGSAAFWAIKFGPLSFVEGYFLNRPERPEGQLTLFEPENGLKYYVYLPEGYTDTPAQPYATIYHLHGAMPFPWKVAKGMVEADVRVLANQMEALVKEGRADPAVIVAPYDGFGFSMWSDSSSGHEMIESQILNTIMPHIQATYTVSKDRSNTFIQGFSMGGFGATKIGFKYPEKFSKITSWDGAIHNWESLNNMRDHIVENMFASEADFNSHSPWLASQNYADNASAHPVKVSLFSGKMAAPSKFTANFDKYLNTLGIAHTLTVTSCQHDPFCFMSQERVAQVYGNEQ
ncbi:alpha/beta hydrolase-fold protein [Flexibacterium corallicola]|uniref:alpha/beta hydrolase-fold protein n=1 Tax=Flexibacterium corallicola TaxID=3037259 RepID=UPI00286F739A|nr:alpha/beta hydrolase-fold protein [Pseudovibrio sp. M1P-2-3]